ncbi:threonylcarbamoyl-AMP synthase [Patescibacteria group bacterium]|nr:threonylcarbamoyl-AMP synthase [Patescibacteria group bacterium]
MHIIELTEKNFSSAVKQAAAVIKAGKAVVYPTDTSYGLAVSAGNPAAVRKMYLIKGRSFKKPVHIFVPSIAEAKKYVKWNVVAGKLAKTFLPGPLSMALPLKKRNAALNKLSAGSGYLGIRIADNKFALALAKQAGSITATSANIAGEKGGFDSYSAQDVIRQFAGRKHKPDLIIDAGNLKKTKPSTFVKISPEKIEILRPGPITAGQIQKALK